MGKRPITRGHWLNDPIMHLLPGTRDVVLPEDLAYVDRRGHRHVFPKGVRSDGMTSMAWTWSFIGCPLTPEYRRPCVGHDYYVVTKRLPWRDAHLLLCEMLEEARDGRLWRLRVGLFRQVLLRWGPRWDVILSMPPVTDQLRTSAEPRVGDTDGARGARSHQERRD